MTTKLHALLFYSVYLSCEGSSNETQVRQKISNKKKCSVDRYNFTHYYDKDVDDFLWHDYFELVYGERKAVDIHSLNFFYKGTALHIDPQFHLSLKPMHTNVDAILSLYANLFSTNSSKQYYPDNDWAEVTRFSVKCMSSYFFNGVMYNEGWNSTGAPFFPSFREKNRVNCGCWFQRVRGSGVFVNVGKTLVAKSRPELHNLLKITCSRRGRGNCFVEGDKNYCTRALILGYDSIQFDTVESYPPPFGEMFSPELIICNGNCSTESVTSSCVPVATRTGIHATIPCTCDKNLTIINCGYAINVPIESCETKRRPGFPTSHQLQSCDPMSLSP